MAAWSRPVCSCSTPARSLGALLSPLKVGDLRFTGLGALLSPLKVGLNHSQLTGNLIVFSVGFFSQEPGLLQLVLKGIHALLIGEGTVLKHLTHALGFVSSLGGFSQLGGGGVKTLH